ncbi:helix-turn-helix domain-containing protein [Intrasporangium zincisolvens]|uniref:helix-turn-helix domain-containing protein n=1 Tax=Intrasporangium zincisolvens TaxID=3080018 RepID=UPI0039B73E99
MTDDGPDVPGYVRRVRRLADLSQRELAAQLGLSRAQVGRMETGERDVSVGTMSRILLLAGLRLQVVDASGGEVPPVPRDVLRDHAERHFPSHLDVAGPAGMPAHRGANPRKGRPDARGWFTLRDRRAEARDRSGTQVDHPTPAGMRRARIEGLARRRAEWLERHGPEPEPVCECLDACFEELCLPTCPCQCEPDRRRQTRGRALPDAGDA